MIKTMIAVMGLLVSCAWGQSNLPTLDDCDKIAFVAARLSSDYGKTQEAREKAELIHSRGADRIESQLASCRLVAMSRADITRVNNYADLETALLREDYDTLRELTKKLQSECH
jgi:hypothetical protein